MSRYAENTSVSVAKSITDIQETVERFGADGFGYAVQSQSSMVEFVVNGVRVRFGVDLPDRSSHEFTKTPSRGTDRTSEAAYKAWEQACRRKWRALALSIKAKLAAVDEGVFLFEEEFMPHIVLPNGRTVKDLALPNIRKVIAGGRVPDLLALPASQDVDVVDAEVVS